MKHYLLLIAVLGSTASSCYSKRLILQADAVSMTRLNAENSKQLKIAGDVNETWCIKTDPSSVPGQEREGQVGLADQVIYKAQNGGKEADFITDARIWVDSNGCAILTGKRAKL